MLLTLKCHSTIRRLLPPNPTKVGVLSLHLGNSQLKVFSSLKQSHCTAHQEGLNANISLYFCPNSCEPLNENFLAAFLCGCVLCTIFDFFLPVLLDVFHPNVLHHSITNSQSNSGTHPVKTLWISELIWEV